MLRDKLIDTAIRLRIDAPLRNLRSSLHPSYKHDRMGGQSVHNQLKTILSDHSNCIDIGAYRGRVLLDIVQLAPHGKHIAYEPLPHLYKQLVERFPTVDVRQAALSNEEGQATFTYVKNIPAESGFREKTYSHKPHIEKLTVQTAVLDKSLPSDYVPTLIKIDVEGAERQVLEGAIKTITTHKPTIIFEHGKGSATYYGTTPRHIFELLHDEAGLQIFDMDGNGPYTLAEFEASYELDERWDYIARP